MTDITLSGKFVSDDGVSSVPGPVEAEGGKVKPRLADLDKEGDKTADTLEEPTVAGEGGPIKKRPADLNKKANPTADTLPKPPLSESEKGDCDDEEDDEDEDEDDSEEDKKENPFEKVKESSEILKVFEDVELSEETKHKLKVIFEAAVIAEASSMVEAEVSKKIKAISEKYEEDIKALKESHESDIAKLEENLDLFVSDAQNKWLEENRIAIQDAKTVELAETFVNNLKDLFAEHNISMEIESSDVISAMEEEVAEAKEQLNASLLETVALKKELAEMKSEIIFAEIAEGLTTSQSEKLRDLSKKLVMENEEQFKTDLISIKESFFPTQKIIVKEEKEEVALTESTDKIILSEDVFVNEIVKAINARKNS